jgi:hypothetical protein
MRGSKGLIGPGMVAALAVLIAGGSAGAATHVAVEAKKCRVHGIPMAKKSCKKPVSLVRATLTWSGGDFSTDYDLYVFGAHGTSHPTGNGITKSKASPNVDGPSGTETFTDLLWRKGGARSFRFGVCHQTQNGSMPVTYTIDYVTTDGRHHTDSHTGDEGFNAVYGNGGAAPTLGTLVCPAL